MFGGTPFFSSRQKDTEYYTILGLHTSCSPDDIKYAYKTLAKKHHPDRAGGDANVFKNISHAYNVLKDPKKRKMYDRFGKEGVDLACDPISFDDLFGAFYSRNEKRKEDTHTVSHVLSVGLEELYSGKDHQAGHQAVEQP